MKFIRYPHEDLQKRDERLLPAIEKSILRVARNGYYVGGPEVVIFEDQLRRIHNMPHCVGVSNGLDALRLILRAAIITGRLKKGDGVIVPANTYVASVLAITDNGLRPIFVDASAATMNLDTALLAQVKDARAIMPVHLYGRACWDEVLENYVKDNQLFVVEDNAQAIGATWKGRMTGTFGDAAAFSFYPTKNIGAMGDAGAVLTRHADLAEAIRALRNYGSLERYNNIYEGLNCRLDPIQAAVLRVKLEHLDEITDIRNSNAVIYNKFIVNPLVELPEIVHDGTHVYHQYVVRVENRDAFRKYLLDKGVQTAVHYATPPYRQECYRRFAHVNMPVSDKIADTCVSLPISEATSGDDARKIALIINGYRGT